MPRLNKKKEEEIITLMECDPDFLKYQVTVISGKKLTAIDFLEVLNDLVQDYFERPDDLIHEVTISKFVIH